MHHSDQAKSLFLQEMKQEGVVPLTSPKKSGKTVKPRQSPIEQKIDAIQTMARQDRSITADTTLKFARPEVCNTAAYNRLAKGRIEPTAYLDLHHLTLKEAGAELAGFLADDHHHCVSVIHGKGTHGDTSIMKSFVAKYLTNHARVRAFHSAPANKGGTGAVLVLLK